MMNDVTEIEMIELEEIAGARILLTVNNDLFNLNDWLSINAPRIRALLNQNGAVLIRSLPIQGSKKLERVLTTLFDNELMEYNYRSTPRTKMRGKIYTSSEYHSDETIGLHNENAYSNQWAMNIAFYCVKNAEVGGSTPIADSQKVYQSIPIHIREKFEKKGLIYIRNYGDIDLPWNEVFQTTNRKEVEQYCIDNGIEYKWKGESGLRTKQHANASYIHPRTGHNVWFNQAHLFHVSSFSKENSASLLETFDKDDLPRNVYYGDGEDIESNYLDEIRNAYLDNKITFDWEEGDLLLLDNMRYAHGRQPFSGNRRVLVGMATPMDSANVKPVKG